MWQLFSGISTKVVRGIAWAPNWTVPYINSDFGAKFYFHSQSYKTSAWSTGGIPVVRTNENDRSAEFGWVALLKGLVTNAYKGYVIFGNEPDRWDQDNATVESMAQQYKVASDWLTKACGPTMGIRPMLGPDIKLVVGNAIDPGYTAQLAEKITLRPQDEWGIHIYENARLPGDPGWTWPKDRLDRLKSLMGARFPNKLWVTEYGLEKAWPTSVTERYLQEIEQHPNVSHAFVYTTHPGNYSPHASLFGLYKTVGQRDLTVPGTVYSNNKLR